MNPVPIIPARLRGALYLIFGVGSLVLLYLKAKGIAGVDELQLWTGLGVFFGATAAANVGKAPDAQPVDPPAIQD